MMIVMIVLSAIGMSLIFYLLMRGLFSIPDLWRKYINRQRAYKQGYYEGVDNAKKSIKRKVCILRKEPKLIDMGVVRSVDELLAFKPDEWKFNACNAISLIDYLNDYKPADKMCISNSECFDLENAFFHGDWEKVIRYINKYAKPCD